VGRWLPLRQSAAILTDAFPAEQRGMAMGIKSGGGDRRLAGGLSGGVLTLQWRLVFLCERAVGISAPFGRSSSCARNRHDPRPTSASDCQATSPSPRA